MKAEIWSKAVRYWNLKYSIAIAGIAFFSSLSLFGQSPQILRGNMPTLMSSLRPIGTLPETNSLNLAISLPLRNQAGLNKLLKEIYDPSSPDFHHYLTPQQFTEKFGPTESDYKKLIAFAQANGLKVTTTHPNRMILDVNGSVSNVQRALHVTMLNYKHPTENRNFFAPDREPSLNLTLPILHIGGLDNYSLPRPHMIATPLIEGKNVKPASGSGPSGSFMGNDFRAAYVPDTTLRGSGQSVGLLQFDGYTASDITYYESQSGLTNVPLQNILIDGASGAPSGSGGEVEVSLDIEMAISMAPALSNVILYIAPNPSPFEDILNRMATDDQAKQLSCSWYIPGGTSNAVTDQIFQQMAAQGQSFFNASGDSDAYTGLIDFPGDTPYITQVGGTTLTTSSAGGSWTSEKVWNWGNGIGSGGGISTQYPIPSWQTNINMTANQGSTTMRNTPDVALTADNVYVRADSNDYNVGGTSCAAPLWAGFAALVNQQATSSGKPPVGFINPLVDAIGTSANYTLAFHDITTGNNESSSSPTKFIAVAGYDLCTGWGTPAGQNLINALANPEPLVITPSTGFTSAGGFGGPFTVTSQTFSLTNAGTNSLTWTLANTSVWLNVSSNGGMLIPGGAAANVTASLNSAASNLVTGTYTATLWFTNLNSGVGQGRPFNLSVVVPPVITIQPANQAVIEGSMANFSVTATGGLPLAYQWQFYGTNLINGGNFSGVTTTNLIIDNTSSNNLGAYTVIVTNVAGFTVSSNASLTFSPSAPIIISQPVNQSAILGSTATFSVATIGTKPFFYQWTFNGTNIDYATNSTLSLTNVQLNQSGIYSVLITNIYGSINSSNATLNVYTVPVITSIYPMSGSIGTAVNINGLNFDPVVGNNVVYFGGVQATVNAASATNLEVSVPAGATYAPVTETVGGLTAYSPMPFLPTFPGASALTNSSLGSQITIPTGNGPGATVIADFDGDGKPDLAVNCGSDHTIYVYRNISTNGILSTSSFASPVVIQLGTGGEESMVAADVDGDGKQDLVFLDYNSNSVVVLQNLSTPGNINFGPRVNFAVGSGPVGVAVGDLDGDGKPDIVTANFTGSTISILRNISTAGIINTNSFAAATNMTASANTRAVAIADLDGDGKPDIIELNENSSTSSAVSVYRNTSTQGNISLAARQDFSGPVNCYKMAIGDMDGDGKLDIVFVSFATGQSVSVYRNISTPGSIALAPRIDFSLGGWGNWVAVGDLDGDGKPDIAAVTQSSSKLSLFRNISTAGIFTNSSLASRLDFASGSNPYGVAIGDLDGDGRPDIVFVNNKSTSVSIYQNITPIMPFIISSPLSQTNFVGATITFTATAGGTAPLSYQWNFNGTNIIGATNISLVLTNIQLSQAGVYSILVTNAYGSALSSNATLVVNPLFHFVWNQIPSPRFANAPFTVIIQAQNITNGLATNFAGIVYLSSTNGFGMNPTASGNFIQGEWTGAVTVAQTGTNVVLKATDSLGDFGLANAINIVSVPALATTPSGNTLYISWPVSPSGFVLEMSPNLLPGSWIPVSAPPIQIGNQNLEPITISGTNAFYRLRFNGQ